MSAVAEPSKQLDQELVETREIARQRRVLEAAVSDRREDLQNQQKVISGLLPSLSNPNDHDAERRMTAERTRLRLLQEALQAAERELDEFSRVHPTEQQIAERERELLKQADDEQYFAHRQLFADTVAKRLELLDKVRELEKQATGIYSEAKRRWPYAQGVEKPAHASIPSDLVSLLPSGLYPDETVVRGPFSGGPDPGFVYHRKVAARLWLEKWNLSSETKEKQ